MEGTIGEIRMFGGNFAPRTWAFCNGQLLPISQNTALFSIIGTIYGGDGRTTFALPDLRGRTVIGPGQGPGLSDVRQGARSGTETVTLTTQNMPSHTHTLNVSGAAGTASSPANNYLANSQVQIERGGDTFDVMSYGPTANSTMGGSAIGNSGGSIPVNTRNPYLGIYYIICLQGIFPSRN
ncbi:phage tail protein [Algoriphagus halophilus]|uniref:Microcystin-dependent protein n=1 Tax=Algoriphagus halophilus TaxID=226505 RepID=A0A1N6E3U0_9BACT|nr:tail fiber protein [Algoriphagus halophilus]SIN77674.1 Microcystin-dependent protein [Algoriphagus halophilus]